METLDAKNLLCPMPVIRLQQLAKQHPAGTNVLVLCTDPGAQYDIPDWCEVHGHTYLGMDYQEQAHVWEIRVRLGRAASSAAAGSNPV